MRITRLTFQRATGILLGLLAVFSLINYSFELGLFGRRGAKGLLLLTIGLGIFWWACFAPTQRELREDHERRKAEKSR